MAHDDITLSVINWHDVPFSICDAPLERVTRDMLDEHHPALAFEREWLRLKSVAESEGFALPQRKDFHPGAVASTLKWLLVFNHCSENEGGHAFQVRLVGTAAEVLLKNNYTGFYLDEMAHGSCLTSRLDMFDLVRSRLEPGYGYAQLGDKGEFNTSILLGLYPFGRNGDVAEELFIVVAPSHPDQRALL